VVSPVFELFGDEGPFGADLMVGEHEFEILTETPLALVEFGVEVVRPFFPALVGSLEVALVHEESKGYVLPVYSISDVAAESGSLDTGREELDLFGRPFAFESVHFRDEDKELVFQVNFRLPRKGRSEDANLR
jgi:hypothetical protein